MELLSRSEGQPMIDMHPDDQPKIFAFTLFGAPLLAWLTVAAWIRQHADGPVRTYSSSRETPSTARRRGYWLR